MIERPLDLLSKFRGRKIVVVLKDNKELKGILFAFDININLAIETIEDGYHFIRGDSISHIKPGENIPR